MKSNTNMKSKTTQYTRILIGGAALMIASTAVADENIIIPEVMVCEVSHGIESEEGAITDEEINIDNEVVDTEITGEEAGNDEGEEIVDDKELTDDLVSILTWYPDWSKRDNDADVSENPDKELTDDLVSILPWYPDWSKHDNDADVSENPEYHYMAAGGPALESQGQNTSTGPQAADEKSAVTMVDAKSITANISRAAAKPTAVKTNGRVFLR
jgi:hypothetical protein